MASVSITPGSVLALAGNSVYKDANQVYQLANAAGATATRAFNGICLNGASVNQPVKVQTVGPIAIGGTVAVGPYCLANVAGQIAPYSDLAAGERVIVIGAATSTGNITISKIDTGANHA